MKKWIAQLIVVMLVMSSFQMTGSAMEDTEAPNLISYSIEEGEYTIGDTVKIQAVVKDDMDPA
ncbi:hypothetical protein, partial [Exiguobacterium sp. ZOR0005]|uniref:hypothetical protein n=1 Tax=Exiguobacterium sp. ZOR0005 TaxID=1339226 RepID=UPI000647DF25